jgi:hypothetical protein
LAINAAVTVTGIVGLSWSAPFSDGGSPVTNYRISYKLGSGVTYTVLDSVFFPTLSYTAGPLTAGSTYYFKVAAFNLVGYGADSSEVNVMAAAKPSVPAAPTTSKISNTSVIIAWVLPADGGSPITGYTVAIKNNVGSFITESANCNFLTVSMNSCTVPIDILQA